MWSNSYRTGDQYLQKNAKMKKGINQCRRGQDQGYKPDMPASPDNHRESLLNGEPMVNAEFMNIRARFRCLPLNKDGLCEICDPEYN